MPSEGTPDVAGFLRPRLIEVVQKATEAGFSRDVVVAVLIDLVETLDFGSGAEKDVPK